MRDDRAEDSGCFYLLTSAAGGELPCGRPRRPNSSFCPEHHRQCHPPPGSRAEHRVLEEAEALAQAVGGRLGAPAREPPEPLLRRLDRISRLFSRPSRSRYVQRGTMAKRTAKSLEKPAPAEQAPTPERQRHGPIERLAQPIADTAGRPARPYRAVDTLAIMERRGSITAAMRQAGEDFRARFAVAQLDPLRALDLTHLRLGERAPNGDRDGPGLRIEAARTAVWRAIQAVGGL